jgi:thiol-disulfide isomerase/thioredoxin
MNPKFKYGLLTLFAIAVIFISGCSHSLTTSSDSSVIDTNPIGFNPQTQTFDKTLSPEILNTKLTDLNTGKDFKLNDFDKPILIESFAVWCPTCTRQQKITKELHEEIGESAISISLDTDPNEDESKILEHTQRNGFTWRYAISPPDLTRTFIDIFGVGFANAPQAPMVLICPDHSAELLKRGVKSTSQLKEAISSCGS